MKNKKADEYVLFLNYDPCMPQGERFKNAFLRGYGECQNEYEEKLRWIPIEEKLPEDCPELFLKKCMSKNVLVKRKWNDTGEIVIEINSRFSPSERIGFLWNYDYKDSEVIEWRSFL